jgi:hypothetical protein
MIVLAAGPSALSRLMQRDQPPAHTGPRERTTGLDQPICAVHVPEKR